MIKTIAGTKVPALGFGTFELKGQTVIDAVSKALAVGYRHIDTAQIYGNEAEVGQAITDSLIERDEIFLTTKVWIDKFADGDLQASVDESLKKLKTDYVDLLLLHWPNPNIDLDETVAALNSVHASGKARNIGISNFTTDLIRKASNASNAPLLMNQVEYHPFLDQTAVRECLEEQGMGLTAYSPLAQGKVFRDDILGEIGDRHAKNPGQVVIRWLLQQQDVVAIPRSANPAHIAANFDVFNFELDEDDMDLIHRLARSDGRVVNPGSIAPDWD